MRFSNPAAIFVLLTLLLNVATISCPKAVEFFVEGGSLDDFRVRGTALGLPVTVAPESLGASMSRANLQRKGTRP